MFRRALPLFVSLSLFACPGGSESGSGGGSAATGGGSGVTGGGSTVGGGSAVGGGDGTGGGSAAGGGDGTGGGSATTGGGSAVGGGDETGGGSAIGGGDGTGGGSATTGGGSAVGGGDGTGGGSATTGGGSAVGGGDGTGGGSAIGGGDGTGGGSAIGGGSAAGGGDQTGGGSAATGGGSAVGGGSATGGGDQTGGGNADTEAPQLTLTPYASQTRIYDVTLRGHVSDNIAVSQLTFFLADSGTPVTPDADGGFIVRFAPFPGHNDFTLVASDSTNTTELNGSIWYGRRIAAGAAHTLYAVDGGLVVWGKNNNGQLGDALRADYDGGFRVSGAYLPNVHDITWVSCGNNTSIALQADGTVLSWGANDTGQLGLGLREDGGVDNTNRNTPQLVPGATNIVSVAAGYLHILMLRSDGQVLAAGDNSLGQLGQTLGNVNSVATVVDGLNDVVQIIGGSAHSAALKRDGTVWVWGRNQYGNLGQGTIDTSPYPKHPTPTMVPGLTNIVMLASGRDHILALRNDGLVWAWGLGSSAQLGQGAATPATSATPLQVLPLIDVVEVAANGNLNFVRRANNTVWAWGQGAQEALGVGEDDTQNKTTPTQTLIVSNVTDIAAGALHGFAIQANGEVWGWGWNSQGTLGGGPSLQNNWAYGEAILVALP